jgi:hypothetical protein
MRPGVFLYLLSIAVVSAQGPPPPLPPPSFMAMKGFPLVCFDKPAFVEAGLEFFVCQGGAGLGGVRKKADPAGTIYVGDLDIALNLNMKAAQLSCKGKFVVRGFPPRRRSSAMANRFTSATGFNSPPKPIGRSTWPTWTRFPNGATPDSDALD